MYGLAVMQTISNSTLIKNVDKIRKNQSKYCFEPISRLPLTLPSTNRMSKMEALTVQGGTKSFVPNL